ncbi:hypothetical protein [Nocardia carnea]|uniref:hypothetical protein n=1 Tax=Nocardia carnea TaxID=37328 RepID=UPI0002F3EEF5|nr:hypothetical protein [Nocardia carnea]
MPQNDSPAAHSDPAPYRSTVGKTVPAPIQFSARSGSRLLMVDSDGQGNATIAPNVRHGDESGTAPGSGDDRA